MRESRSVCEGVSAGFKRVAGRVGPLQETISLLDRGDTVIKWCLQFGSVPNELMIEVE